MGLIVPLGTASGQQRSDARDRAIPLANAQGPSIRQPLTHSRPANDGLGPNVHAPGRGREGPEAAR
jgi:hypothetical protein